MTVLLLTLELPWPDPALVPNRKNGRHWASVHAAKTKRLADAHALTLHAMRQQRYDPPAPGQSLGLGLRLTFCAPDKRRRDLDNLLAAMKADLDGMAQALGVDDQVFNPIILERGAAGKPPGGVWVWVGVERGD